MNRKPHRLAATSISDAGHVDLEVVCPAWPFDRGKPCPAIAALRVDAPEDGTPCLVAYVYGYTGPSIVAGRASGAGPWTVELSYGDDGEPRLQLVDEEPG